MRCTYLFLCPLCLSVFTAPPASAAGHFELVDGDRVVLLGNTLIEREQRYGYWETLLTIRYPHRRIQFRNLGWSGDTVFGEARAGFGTLADGFRRLKEHVLALRPTVIFIGYGLNESFEGAAGLPRFREGLRLLLDTLAPTKARIVLLSPLRHEDLGRPLPDPTEHNKSLRLYGDALRKAAEQRGYLFVDLYDLLGDGTKSNPPAALTDNGIHLTAYGYWRAAAALERGLGLAPLPGRATLEPTEKGTIKEFKVIRGTLPPPPPPANTPPTLLVPGDLPVCRVAGLAPGTYQLKIDGQPVATGTAAQWADGLRLSRGPELEQVERLRRAIIEKNRLYFYRWRPQNETYLYGFRKHEQGQNAREIPQFDPLVAKQEEEIAKLRVPVSHTYELVPTAEKPR
jgi:lysophospholipase L1-like esterase